MIPRRSVVTGGVLGGLLGALTTADDVAAAPVAAPAPIADINDDMVNRVVRSLADIRAELLSLRSFDELTPVRNVQLPFLRVNGKFPDYIEVGVAVWMAVHDWHVRWQQPLNIGRDATGRHTLVLNQTTLILRADAEPRFVGLAYDAR
jgi:hypothetical protein